MMLKAEVAVCDLLPYLKQVENSKESIVQVAPQGQLMH